MTLYFFQEGRGKYRIFNELDIQAKFGELEKKQLIDCDEQECLQQIGYMMNADILIYGQMEKKEGKINLFAQSLIRNKDNDELTKKVVIMKKFHESQSDWYAHEIVKKMIQPDYKIDDSKAPTKIRVIQVPSDITMYSQKKMSSIKLMKFRTDDDAVQRIADILKRDLTKGDRAYNNKEYSDARDSYNSIINGIEEKITHDKQQKLASFKEEVEERVVSTYKMEFNEILKEGDSYIKKRKDDQAHETYSSIPYKINKIASRYRNKLDSYKTTVNRDRVEIYNVEGKEKEARELAIEMGDYIISSLWYTDSEILKIFNDIEMLFKNKKPFNRTWLLDKKWLKNYSIKQRKNGYEEIIEMEEDRRERSKEAEEDKYEESAARIKKKEEEYRRQQSARERERKSSARWSSFKKTYGNILEIWEVAPVSIYYLNSQPLNTHFQSKISGNFGGVGARAGVIYQLIGFEFNASYSYTKQKSSDHLVYTDIVENVVSVDAESTNVSRTISIYQGGIKLYLNLPLASFFSVYGGGEFEVGQINFDDLAFANNGISVIAGAFINIPVSRKSHFLIPFEYKRMFLNKWTEWQSFSVGFGIGYR